MEALFDPAVGIGRHVLVVFCLALAFGFEFVNGFHDTANAVATVIYTHSLRPWIAVIISGICNFMGVFLGGIAVALGIIKLLPVELVVSGGVGAGLAMVLALLAAAIIWNLGTWSLGLPASSSHTLIGAILGVGLANSMLAGHHFGQGLNWEKAGETGVALIISPLIGFTAAGLLVALVRRIMKRMNHPRLEQSPQPGKPPPWPVRALLIATCGGVSFAHGSNDGQKGVGLVMLILIALVPASYALNVDAKADEIAGVLHAAEVLEGQARDLSVTRDSDRLEQRVAVDQLHHVRTLLAGRTEIGDMPRDARFQVRQAILLADKAIDDLIEAKVLDKSAVASSRESLRCLVDYAPRWVLLAIALSLGIGTMIGWKRIVVTVGEKIGKQHLTYAQGASAELVATATIGLSATLGLPVSTTHVLSSGVAGTMVAQGSGIQGGTARNIALAWILTLPAAIVLAGTLYLILHFILV